MFHLDRIDEMTLLRMRHGPVNAMDLEFCREFLYVLSDLENSDTAGVLLTGNDRVFSAGVDLKRWLREDDEYVEPFLDALDNLFGQAFRFGKPLVAVINSHAIAGGCMLANAADYRVIAPHAKIGIPEMRIGVPLPMTAIEIMRFVARRDAFPRIVNVGATFVGDEAVAVGLADEVVSEEAMMEVGLQRLRELTAIPPPAFQLTKRQIRDPIWRQVEQNRITWQKRFIEVWQSPATREAVRRYVEERLSK
ncbi:MAG TPA: enoyl-CoA hydratase/isomerase family protein [Pirellulaceae bacterium]|nr:enoyl-CoA hydratase/isomerase family protein [Pirellulaceae bacterium]